jgi:hypothetical protein
LKDQLAQFSRAIAQAVSRRLSNTRAPVQCQVRSCGICNGQNNTGTGFPHCICFLCHFSFRRLLHTHLSSGTMAGVQSGLSLHPTIRIKNCISSKEESRVVSLGYCLVVCCAYSSTLKVKIVSSSETSVKFYWTTPSLISEYSTLQWILYNVDTDSF